jgi:hypothetical protein
LRELLRLGFQFNNNPPPRFVVRKKSKDWASPYYSSVLIKRGSQRGQVVDNFNHQCTWTTCHTETREKTADGAGLRTDAEKARDKKQNSNPVEQTQQGAKLNRTSVKRDWQIERLQVGT